MFGFRVAAPRANLTTERLSIRLATPRDAWHLADYYTENWQFLLPWEPKRDKSFQEGSHWQNQLGWMEEMQRLGQACHFLVFDPRQQTLLGVANYTNIIRGAFHACYLGYSLAEKVQGQGLMFEALQATNQYMQQQQNLHRIMANYMPRNQRSGRLLQRLGFEVEGQAKAYLQINGVWEDHILTALTTTDWKLAKKTR